MNKHTPGGFTHLIIEPIQYITSDEAKALAYYEEANRQEKIARAAPDLLEALKAIMESCDAGYAVMTDKLRMDARAAIEKATS